MDHEIRVEPSTGGPLAVVRRSARPEEFGRVVPEACGLVWNALRARNVSGAGRHVAIYRDGPVNLEVGVELNAPFEGDSEVVGSTVPKGEVAATTHFGPYGGLGEAHQAIHRWAAAQGRELDGTRWEVYGHWTEAWNSDPSQIRTDVYYLLKPTPA